jgi:hypothetical protein
MLDSLFPTVEHNMSALHESLVSLPIHARGTLTNGTDACAPPILPLRFFQLGQPLEEGDPRRCVLELHEV